ncbi:MAG: DUF695 domain-containing protein [Sphingobacteriales bacterium]|nr:MAG: DUF695 domain-containing protein [Sphingobacteriales bacterium]
MAEQGDILQLFDSVEDSITGKLEASKGHLHIGRQTANDMREIYFACNDFRRPAKVLHEVQNEYGDRLKISYDIYKDKYWRSFKRFQVS